MMLLYDLLTQVTIPKPDGFWPSTIVGWIDTLGFVCVGIFTVFKLGRYSSRLEEHEREAKRAMDGLGQRITKVETAHEYEEGRVSAIEVQLSGISGKYEALIQILGEAKGSVDGFRNTVVRQGEKLEAKIDDLRKEQNETKLEIAQRLTRVEAQLIQQ